MDKTKVLYYSEGWGMGGIERFVMSVISRLDPALFSFDVFCTHDWSGIYDEQISVLGGQRYTVFHDEKPNLVKRFRASTRAWRHRICKDGYDVVHVCTMNGMGFAYADIARECGVPLRIVHSHNTDFGMGHRALKAIAHHAGKMAWGFSPNVRLACSEEAGYYLFGNSSFEVVNNGIDTKMFAFNEGARMRSRDALGIPSDAFVVGTVGRMEESKRPLFQIGFYAELVRMLPEARFIHVGAGPLLDETKEYARHLGVYEGCCFVEQTDAPQDYMSAMDAFILPSSFEGLPIVVIEAQCSGLRCYVTETLSRDADITDLLQRVEAREDAARWAEIVAAEATSSRSTEPYAQSVALAGFDVSRTAHRMTEIYQSRLLGERD